jgi:hypothetical protein
MRFNVLCLIVLSLLCCLVTGAAAVSISINPSQIQEGDTITVSYSGLSNGSAFALRMESLVDVTGKTTFTYQANQVSMPFGLNSPQVVLSASPVTEAGIEASEGDTIKRITQISRTGTVSISQSLGNLPAGTMELIKAFGTPEVGADAVNVVLEFSGIKMGPDSGTITFSLTGITDGSARVIALVDGNIVTDQTILVGNPSITTTPTTSPTSPPSSGGGGGSSGGGATETPTTTPEAVSVSSLDGIVTLLTVEDAVEGAEPADLRIIRSTPPGVPDDWQVLAGSYIVSPSAATFDPAASLSFDLSGVNATTPFVAAYRDGAWTIVPSRYEGTALVATVSSGGQYALMAYAAVGTGTTTPEVTETAPVTTTEVVTTTPASAWGTAGVIGALAVAVMVAGRRRRS